jgi:hypothetical protein
MRFVIFKGEKSVNDLAARIFRIQGDGSQAATRQAADALVKANPQLADLSKVPVGSVITVPDNAPAISPDEQAVASGAVRSLTAKTVQSAFDALQQRLTDIESSAANQLKTAMDRIQTSDFKTALKILSDQSSPQLADRVPSLDAVAKDTEDMMKSLQSSQDLRKQSLTQLQTALASFANK